MYEIIGYCTDHYDAHGECVRRRDFRGVRQWAREFLSEPGRKVIVYRHEKMRYRWGRKIAARRRKVVEWTEPPELVDR